MSETLAINKQKTVKNPSSHNVKEGQENKKIKDGCCGKKFPDILGGIIFIAAGIILLLNNFNIVSWSIWSYLVIFWPVIFVFIGLDIISGNSLLLKFITTLIGLIIISFILTYSLTAIDLSFRDFMFNRYPFWKKVYEYFPKTYDNTRKGSIKSGDYLWNNPDYFRN